MCNIFVTKLPQSFTKIRIARLLSVYRLTSGMMTMEG